MIMRKMVSTFGQALLAGFAASTFVVEEVINPLRQFRVDAVDQFQLRQGCARDAARRAEAVEQSALARGADAIDLVERILGDARFALAAMGADCESVRLVAQALQVVEDRAFL